jgi:7,8-dihydropterin-6-yl-methyl-4-(beta-D-ribofuranosyl)aminobenzene 5'-phosphate synthase
MPRITVLVENTAAGQGLLAEHGLAIWIEHGGHRILFDTGQGYALKKNARHLGIPLDSAEAIVLSHGHYDHTGGLAEVIQMSGLPRVFLHPAALAPRYARSSGGASRAIGMPESCVEAVRGRAEVIWTESPTEIYPGIHVTGPVPRMTDFEDTGGPFFEDARCERPDLLPDDQALFLETERGLVVIAGCAHAGVINTLNYIQKLTGEKTFYSLIGGMHLAAAGPERMAQTIAGFRRFGLQQLMPGHCTGFQAMARLWHEFTSMYRSCVVGAFIEFED